MTIWRRRERVTDDKPDVERARRDLAETREQTPRYEALAESLRLARRRNHLAESLEAILRESR